MAVADAGLVTSDGLLLLCLECGALWGLRLFVVFRRAVYIFLVFCCTCVHIYIYMLPPPPPGTQVFSKKHHKE